MKTPILINYTHNRKLWYDEKRFDRCVWAFQINRLMRVDNVTSLY